ncbi:MAG: tRNA (guanosine(46)-N7)-methyltransferase TrmB [Planctomycetota bacterium]
MRRHTVPVKSATWPLDPESIFGRPGPFGLEIGFGNGAFAEREALQAPDWNFLAVEISWSCVHHLFKRIEHSDIHNLKIIRSDAAFVLRELIPANSLYRVVINHPDPWPKGRHVGRRLLQAEFFALLSTRMRRGAEVRIATDHAGYAEWIGKILEDQDNFVSIYGSSEVPDLEGHLVTKYQAKAQAQGIDNHFFVWKKTAADAPSRPRQEPEAMPNVLLSGHDPSLPLFADFEPIRAREVHDEIDITVSLQRVYHRIDDDQWLVECTVNEGAFKQQVAVIVVEGDNGQVVIKLSGLGHPRATYGVKRAVHHVVATILARHPGIIVDHSTVGEIAR